MRSFDARIDGRTAVVRVRRRASRVRQAALGEGSRETGVEELRRRYDLTWLARARPEKLDQRVAAVLFEIEPDVVFLAGRERDRAGIFLGAVIDPVVDDQLTVDPQHDAVVRKRVEVERTGEARHHLAGPPNGERVGADRGIRCVRAEVEV